MIKDTLSSVLRRTQFEGQRNVKKKTQNISYDRVLHCRCTFLSGSFLMGVTEPGILWATPKVSGNLQPPLPLCRTNFAAIVEESFSTITKPTIWTSCWLHGAVLYSGLVARRGLYSSYYMWYFLDFFNLHKLLSWLNFLWHIYSGPLFSTG